MRVLLTGGSGDLGRVLVPQIIAEGNTPVIFDLRPPSFDAPHFIQGSITDRDPLAHALQNVACVVHIAAWHGLHEVRRQKDEFDFWDVNVTGTFNVFELAARASIQNVIFISSTSVMDTDTFYGQTKILGEQVATLYAERHGLNVITLRPRAFIPHWNTEVYSSFVEWAKWFWGGAVHINDVAQAVMKSLKLITTTRLPHPLILTVDGAYEYTDADLAAWDESGATFKKYYAEYEELARQHGLDPTAKPTRLDISETQHWLGYQPTYSLKNLLEELKALHS